MAKWVKVLFGVAFSFMFVFMAIGYATLADTLVINGDATVEGVPETVVIMNVEKVDSATTGNSVSADRIIPTAVDSRIEGSSGQTVTYKITVQNFSAYKYSYVGITCDESVANNNIYGSGITVVTKNSATDSTGTFGAGTTIEAKGTVDDNGNPLDTLTFYATYTIRNGAPASINTILNYQFGVHTDDAGKAAVDGSLEQFENVLNTDSMYDSLMNKYNSNVSSGLRGDYVGNVATSLVAGWFTDDDELIIDLFGDTLVLGETEVKTLIKKMNVDGKTGDEMVIFLTPTDILGMKISNSRTYIPDVYCAVFTNSQYAGDGTPEGTWYQIGDLYNGKAYGLRYTTGTNPSGWFNADCINPGTWVSVEGSFEVNGEYSYSVAANKGIANIIQNTSNSISSATGVSASDALNSLFEDAERVKKGNFTGTGWNNFKTIMTELKDVYGVYTEDADGNIVMSDGLNHGQTVSAIRELDAALKPFREWLDS